jgi:hypothetical protein
MKRDRPIIIGRISADLFQHDPDSLRRRMTGSLPPTNLTKQSATTLRPPPQYCCGKRPCPTSSRNRLSFIQEDP